MFESKAFIVAIFCIAATMAACPEPKLLTINNCISQNCHIVFNKEAEIKVNFTAVNDIDDLNLTFRISSGSGGAFLPFKISETKPCESLINGKCPLKQGQEVTYRVNITIPETDQLVAGQVGLDFNLLDDNNNGQVCFVTYVQILTGKRNSYSLPN